MKSFNLALVIALVQIFLTLHNVQAAEKFKLRENISVSVVVSGDVQGTYEVSGPLGLTLEATSSKPDSVCQFQFQLRKVLYRTHNALEVWPKMECTIDGHKQTYKPHRFFLELAGDSQKIKWMMLDKKLQNIVLEFKDLSLLKSK